MSSQAKRLKIFHGSDKLKKKPPHLVIALGNFDGVHLAHQRLIKLAIEKAKKKQGQAYVYTFEPHPVKVLSKVAAPLMIHTLEQKSELIEKLGVDGVIFERFDKNLARMTAKEWFDKIAIQRLKAATIITGYDFTFGYQRSGTVETLQELCKKNQVDFNMLSAQLFKKTLISSTQIRHFIEKGDIVHSNELLGYPFFIDGEIIAGQGRGKQLGIPTANLKTQNELIPPRGVYVCRALYKKQSWDAVTNIGINPTFGGQTLSIETHLIDFSKEVYGETLRLHFYKKLRDEKTFASVKDLSQQIKKDITQAKSLLNKSQDKGIDPLLALG